MSNLWFKGLSDPLTQDCNAITEKLTVFPTKKRPSLYRKPKSRGQDYKMYLSKNEKRLSSILYNDSIECPICFLVRVKSYTHTEKKTSLIRRACSIILPTSTLPAVAINPSAPNVLCRSRRDLLMLPPLQVLRGILVSCVHTA